VSGLPAIDGSFEFACLIPGHYESKACRPLLLAQSDEAPAHLLVCSPGQDQKSDAKGKKGHLIHGPLKTSHNGRPLTMVFKLIEALTAKIK